MAKLYLKMDGETIMGFSPTFNGDYNVELDPAPENVGGHPDITDGDGNIKYKRVNSVLVELDQAGIDVHPLKIRKGLMTEIYTIKGKEDKKEKINKWKDVKKDPSMTQAHIDLIDELIAELEA